MDSILISMWSEKNISMNKYEDNLSDMHFENLFPCGKAHAKLINDHHNEKLLCCAQQRVINFD